MPKSPVETLLQTAVESLLTNMAKGRMTQIVAQADRLSQVFVQSQSTRNRSRYSAGLQRVGQPRAVVIALGKNKNLSLVLQATEAL